MESEASRWMRMGAWRSAGDNSYRGSKDAAFDGGRVGILPCLTTARLHRLHTLQKRRRRRRQKYAAEVPDILKYKIKSTIYTGGCEGPRQLTKDSWSTSWSPPAGRSPPNRFKRPRREPYCILYFILQTGSRGTAASRTSVVPPTHVLAHSTRTTMASNCGSC